MGAKVEDSSVVVKKSNKRMPSLRMVLVALVTSLGGSFHFGYQLVITNPSQAAFIEFLNKTTAAHFDHVLSNAELSNIWSFAVAIMFLGSLCGSFSIRWIADRVGRKKGLYVPIGIGIVSAGASITSYWVSSFVLYVISRVTMGFSISVSLGLSALFLSEASPKECRGSIGMITGTCVQLGTVVGSIIAMPQLLGTATLWYLIYAFEMCMMLVFMALLPLLHESPGYLVQRGRSEEALQSVKFYHICDDGKAKELLFEVEEEERRSVRNYGMLDIVQKASLRNKAMIGMIAAFACAFSGIAVINAYAVEILLDTGLSSLAASLANVGITLVSVVAIVISSLVVDKFGRRPLLLFSFIGLVICNLIIFSLMYTFDKYGNHILGYCLIFVICVFIVFFAIGPGPLCYFITAELVGQSARSAAQSWTSVVQMTCRFILVCAYLPLKNQIQSFAYLLLFVIPVTLSIVYLYFYLPETKNKNYNEVVEAMTRLPTIYTIRNGKEKASTKELNPEAI